MAAPARELRPSAEPAPALRVVPRHIRRRRAGVVIATGVVIVFAVMLGLVAFQAKIAQDQLRIDRMERDLDGAEGQLSRLRLQIAQLQAPERVVAEAQKLGLQRPGPDQIRQITPKAEAVGEVLAAGGPSLGVRPGGSGNLDDWSELKPLLNGP